jgi:CzcA family heavy metal efflux pump
MKSLFTTYKNPIAFILALLIAGGLFCYSRMQTSLFPEITFPKIKIIADNGEQPVDKMMITVTKPLENAVKQVPGLHMIRSTTSRGSCEISAFMDWKSDINIDQQAIESRISQVRNTLPPNVQITVEKMNPSILPVMGYTLESNTKNPIELKMLANYTIRPFLSQVDGVSSIRVIGGKTKEYWITLDPQKMSALGITPDTLNSVITQTNFILSNGYMSDYRRLYLTVTDAGIYNVHDLENIIVKNTGKRAVFLKDIASLEIKSKIEYIRINANGKESILIAVLKQPNANLIDLSINMDKKIEELKRILPAGVFLRPYYKQADFVNDAVHSVTDSLWIGLVLAIVVAIIFLRSFKASAVILLTIPVTLCFTLVVIYALGYALNIMTLGAIAASIGLIIDDAIVVVEQIHRTHEENPGEPSRILIQQSINYLFPAMVGSSISTIVIFIPFVLMSGVAGAYFKVLTDTMIVTLICSFFVTWLGLPVIYLLLSRNQTKEKAMAEKQHKVKKQVWVAFFIDRPIISILIIAGLTASIILIYPLLETGFLPEMDEGSIVLDYASPPGTSLEETDRMLREAEKLITSVPEVASYSRRTGTQMGFFITEQNKGDYLIQLKAKRGRTTDEVIDEIRTNIASTQPALRIDFGQVIGDMLGDLMTSVQPIEIKIFGNDQKKLNELASLIADKVSHIKGAADVFNGITIAGPTIRVRPDNIKLAQYDVSPANFQFQMQAQLEGNIIGGVLEKEQQTDIRILYADTRNASYARLQGESVFLPGGKLKPITELATIELQTGVAEINRENLQSMSIVSARLNGRDLGSVMKDIQKIIATGIALPKGYHVSYGGAYAEQEKSFGELLMILIISSMLIFSVMLFLFRDFRVAFAILLIAVLGISGSYIALFITHTPLNVGSYTGIIMIVGIIGENAIFTYLQFHNSMQVSNAEEAIIYSISTRLRPKLMTALGAIIALMPLALGIGTGAQLHQPLAIAVIGGFITALPLLLIVFPSLLKMIFRKKESTQNINLI